MRFPTRAAVVCCLLGVAAGALATGARGGAAAAARRTITWDDAAPLHARLAAHGITRTTFASHVERIRVANVRRVREGDLDHLIFYLLQATRFTTLPPIEPALSAKAFRDTGRVPAPVRARAAALVRALDSPAGDPRLTYFRELVSAAFPSRREREAGLLREYARVMRFVYEKEFVAQRSPRAADAVAELYRARGLSTDTAVEAGYLVHQGLGVVKALDPERRVRRVLIVGPGLDLAPRTGLIEGGPPESYQPWAVIDALFTLGLSQPGELEVVAADINPRVVEHLRRSRVTPPVLSVVSGIEESDTLTFTQEYRDYFARLGSALGEVVNGGAQARAGALRKAVRVGPDAARALHAQRLDVVTERLAAPAFDLVIATNILPYFGDVELMLAMCNVAAMLAPGGVFLHNEPRPSLGDVTEALGLAFEQSRQAVIATVRDAPRPLVDMVFLHKKASRVKLVAASWKPEAGSW